MNCPNCGTDNRADARFCRRCGFGLALTCPNGHPVAADSDFCDVCGAALRPTVPDAADHASTATPQIAPTAPQAERRLVSVLFADLVGFTSMSEGRDAEEVRDLLSRYFETAQRLIARYGGTVEKFIGDAVMAVWGTPAAKEDDAERAVRAGLDLAQAVASLGSEVGTPGLQARVGVLTGEAAVTLGAQGQGMVAGDLVNTASRIQSAAAPGQVLVGEVTRRATEAAVVYEEAGTHELKGKAESVPLWRAIRVIGGVRGALKASGLEPPFVGRDRELRLVKELFHGSAEEGKAHLVSVVGIAGIGKSRLSWEFFKYIDGLADAIWWHRGRCLAYGEGVTYWALAEMVRMRARIDEGEDAVSAQAKLRETVERHVPDPEERRWIEPRLAHLLGLEEPESVERQDLFAAWRLFFERLCEQSPTILVFEDMQWADPSLLDFIEYLLDWSRSHRLFVIALARPELAEKHPNWAAGKRNSTSLFLEPLSPQVMEELLTGLVPGLPEELRRKIQERAEGVPLYAVETVRMLIDRGLLVQERNRYRPSGPIDALEVPETLHGLIAARLDGLLPAERQLLQDASVLGKTFTQQALSAVTGKPDHQIEPLLSSLIRKEVLSFQTDARSSERGQYGFLQDLVRRVAYETLSKKERKARHLAVAGYLVSGSGFDEEEIAEIVASHYLEAFRTAPEAADAGDVKAKAREALVRAGQRAASLGASAEAQHYFEQAMELADDPIEQAELAERAGEMAARAARLDETQAHYEEAVRLFESASRFHAAARASASLGWVLWRQGHLDEAIARMESALAVLADDAPDEDLAGLSAQLGRLYFFAGKLEPSLERVDRALAIAESLWLPAILSEALNTKSLVLSAQGRGQESFALLSHALKIALDHDVPSAAFRAYNNLDVFASQQDRHEEALEYDMRGLELARLVGDRFWELTFLANLAAENLWLGRWDETLERLAEIPDPEEVPEAGVVLDRVVPQRILINLYRGDIDEAEQWLARIEHFRDSAEVQFRAAYFDLRAQILLARGDFDEAGRAAEEALLGQAALGMGNFVIRDANIDVLEAALGRGDLDTARKTLERLAALPRGEIGPFYRAQIARFGARLAATTGDVAAVEADFKVAVATFREMGMRSPLAVTMLEYGEWLEQEGRSADARPILGEAREIFERLKARTWLERLERTESATLEKTAVST